MNPKKLIFLFCLFFLFQGKAQLVTPVFNNIVDELPSPEVYDIFQDSIGYIWVATDNGISKYDGKKFYEIDVASYTKTNVIFNFFEGPNEKMWISTIENELYWFDPLEENPIFYPYEFNNLIKEKLNDEIGKRFIRKIYFSEDEEIKLTFFRRGGCMIISSNGANLIDNVVGPIERNYRNCGGLAIIIEEDFIWSKVLDNGDSLPDVIKVVHKGETFLIDRDLPSLNFKYGITDFIQNGNEIILLLDNNLVRIFEDHFSFVELSYTGLCLLKDNKRILVGTYSGGYEYDVDLKLRATYLKDQSVSSILKDSDQGLWFSTLHNGLFYTKNYNLKKVNSPNRIYPSELHSWDGKLKVLDDFSNTLWILNKDHTILDSIKEVYSSRRGMYTYNKRIESEQINKYLFKDKGIKTYHYFLDNKIGRRRCFIGRSFYFVKNDSILTNKREVGFVSVNHGVEKDSIIHIATNNGLFEYEFVSNRFKKSEVVGDENRTFSGIYECLDQIVLSTYSGLYLMNNSQLTTIFFKKNETFGKVNGIHFSNDSVPYIYGDKGVFSLRRSSKEVREQEFYRLSYLPNEEVISMSSNKEKLFFGTRRNIYVLDSHIDAGKTEINLNPFVVDSLFINGDKYDQRESLSLRSTDVLSLYFKFISFKKTKSSRFEYQLNNTVWLETNANSLTLSGLPTGENTLRIRSTVYPEKNLFEVSIVVPVPLIERTWFIAVLASFCFGIIYLLTLFWLKIRERRRELKLKKVSLELKLLTSQMNPHFTFNSINSIQYFILKNNKDEAINYLSDFALLIRKTLDFSMNDLISIREEFKFLDLYVALENRRFDTKYQIEYQLEAETLFEKKIPSFMLQPLIENVINHAEYGHDDIREVIVGIEYSDKTFFIEVKDFGQAVKTKTSEDEQKSYGLTILRNRIKIYNGKSYLPSDLVLIPTDPISNKGKTVQIKLKEWI